jgi:hypothetical protein
VAITGLGVTDEIDGQGRLPGLAVRRNSLRS